MCVLAQITKVKLPKKQQDKIQALYLELPGGCSEIDKHLQVLLNRCVLYGPDCVDSVGVCVSLVCVYLTCVWCVVCD